MLRPVQRKCPIFQDARNDELIFRQTLKSSVFSKLSPSAFLHAKCLHRQFCTGLDIFVGGLCGVMLGRPGEVATQPPPLPMLTAVMWEWREACSFELTNSIVSLTLGRKRQWEIFG